jgi:hypothetical protein
MKFGVATRSIVLAGWKQLSDANLPKEEGPLEEIPWRKRDLKRCLWPPTLIC